MNAREVITEELRRMGSFLPHDEADNILLRLRTNGFTIMAKEDVEAVREKALEEAAAMCEEPRRLNDGSEIVMPSGKAYASAIRKLKSKDRAALKEAK